MDSTPVNQSQSTNQGASSAPNIQGVANQNSSNDSGVRQRTVVNQNNAQTVAQQPVAQQPINRGASPNANVGMISLVIMWFVVVSALAFILRRMLNI